jgi:hypothetical protein
VSVLDINTPRGQVTRVDEEKAAKLFEGKFPRWRFISTDKDTMAKADAILLHDNKLGGFVLTSCRYGCTVEHMMETWDSEWLLTWRKLAIGALLARHLQTPLFGFIYFADQEVLLVQRLYDPLKESPWSPYRTERTLTQATVNGGQIMRTNAFIKVDKATRIDATAAGRAGFPAGFVGYDAKGMLVHFCQCGADAGRGVGVSLRNNKLGTWYCDEHLPAEERVHV